MDAETMRDHWDSYGRSSVGSRRSDPVKVSVATSHAYGVQGREHDLASSSPDAGI
jgi:hypothetical protein